MSDDEEVGRKERVLGNIREFFSSLIPSKFRRNPDSELGEQTEAIDATPAADDAGQSVNKTDANRATTPAQTPPQSQQDFSPTSPPPPPDIRLSNLAENSESDDSVSSDSGSSSSTSLVNAFDDERSALTPLAKDDKAGDSEDGGPAPLSNSSAVELPAPDPQELEGSLVHPKSPRELSTSPDGHTRPEPAFANQNYSSLIPESSPVDSSTVHSGARAAGFPPRRPVPPTHDPHALPIQGSTTNEGISMTGNGMDPYGNYYRRPSYEAQGGGSEGPNKLQSRKSDRGRTSDKGHSRSKRSPSIFEIIFGLGGRKSRPGHISGTSRPSSRHSHRARSADSRRPSTRGREEGYYRHQLGLAIEEIHKHRKQLRELEDELHECKEQFTNAKREAGDANTTLDRVRRERNDCRLELDQAVRKIYQERQGHQNEKAKISRDNDERVRIIKNEADTKLQRTESSLTETKTELTRVSSELTSTKQTLSQSQSDLYSARSTITTMEREAREAQVALTAEKTARSNDHSRYQNHASTLNGHIGILKTNIAQFSNMRDYVSVPDDEFGSMFKGLVGRVSNIAGKFPSDHARSTFDPALDPGQFVARRAQRGGRNWPKFVRSLCWRVALGGFNSQPLGFGTFGSSGEGFTFLNQLYRVFVTSASRGDGIYTFPNTRRLNICRSVLFEAIYQSIRSGNTTDNHFIAFFYKNVERVTQQLVGSLVGIAGIRADDKLHSEISAFMKDLGLFSLRMSSQQAHVLFHICQNQEVLESGDWFTEDGDILSANTRVDIMVQPCLRRVGDGSTDVSSEKIIVKGEIVSS